MVSDNHLYLTPDPRYQIPPSGPCGYCTHMHISSHTHRYTHIDAQIKKSLQKIFYVDRFSGTRKQKLKDQVSVPVSSSVPWEGRVGRPPHCRGSHEERRAGQHLAAQAPAVLKVTLGTGRDALFPALAVPVGHSIMAL